MTSKKRNPKSLKMTNSSVPQMKKDLTSAVSEEVTKHITELVKRHFDASTSPWKKLGHQAHLLPPRRHSEYYCNANEKKQRKTMHQDEEQSSDASIERVDEPLDIGWPRDLPMKKDAQFTCKHVTAKSKDPVRLPNKRRDRPVVISCKEPMSSRSSSQLPSSAKAARSYPASSSGARTQDKARARDAERSNEDTASERTDEPQNVNAKAQGQMAPRTSNQSLEQTKLDLDGIDGTENAIKKIHHLLGRIPTRISKLDASVDDDVTAELSQQSSNKKTESESQQRPLLQVNELEEIHLEVQKMMENKYRNSCSVIGHQMLDEDCRNANIRGSFNDLHIGSSSVYSSEVEDDAFEIIQMPVDGNESRSGNGIAVVVFDEQHCSSRDSPSFELLSDLSSPNEDLLMSKELDETPEPLAKLSVATEASKPEERIEQQQLQQQPEHPNPPRVRDFVIDADGKIHEDDHEAESFLDKDTTREEDAPIWDADCSGSSHDNGNGLSSAQYDHVRSSHANLAPPGVLQSQHSRQSQTDLIDFTQSFHSHTTSVTDMTDGTEIYADAEISAYDNGRFYGEQTTPVASGNVRDTGATTATTTTTTVDNKMGKMLKWMTAEMDPVHFPAHDCLETQTTRTTTTTSPGNDFVERASKTAKTKKDRYDANGDSHAQSSSVPPDAPQQSRRANGSAEKPASGDGLQKRCTRVNDPIGAGDPIHILPETLVTAAVLLGSHAYVSARTLLGRMRSHAVRYHATV